MKAKARAAVPHSADAALVAAVREELESKLAEWLNAVRVDYRAAASMPPTPPTPPSPRRD